MFATVAMATPLFDVKKPIDDHEIREGLMPPTIAEVPMLEFPRVMGKIPSVSWCPALCHAPAWQHTLPRLCAHFVCVGLIFDPVCFPARTHDSRVGGAASDVRAASASSRLRVEGQLGNIVLTSLSDLCTFTSSGLRQ